MAATFRVSMVLVLALFSGCKKDKGPSAAASASAKPATVELKGADPALLGELVTIAKTCKVAVEASSVSCPKAENRKLANQFVSNQKPRAEGISTLAAALSHPEPEVRVVSANVLYSAFRSAWTDTKPGSVKPADADALIDAAFKAPKAQARQILPAAVHAAALSGRTAQLDTALAKATEPEYKTIVYRHLMTHGRLAAFEQVKTAAKSQNPSDVLAALESPRNMQAWTSEEQQTICPWASDFLADTRPSVASRAASLLGNCGGEFVDKLLTKGEDALKNKNFTTADVAAFRELCGPRKRGQANGPSEEQCTRARKLLEKVVETKTLDVAIRTTALTTLAYQWADDQTLKLAKKLEKSPDKVLAEQATRTVQRLEQRAAMGSASAGGRIPMPPFGAFPPGAGSARLMPMRRMPGAGDVAPPPGATPPPAPAPTPNE
jgi:hypothetical protein